MLSFERLEHVTDMIARHPDYPGKPVVVQECLEDIEEHCRRGRLTPEQRDRLVAVLVGPRHVVPG